MHFVVVLHCVVFVVVCCIVFVVLCCIVKGSMITDRPSDCVCIPLSSCSLADAKFMIS